MDTTQMKVNFLDLKAQYASIKGEIDEAIQNVLDDAAFAGGPYVKKFEEGFAAAQGAKYCVAVCNGTAALHIIMMALELGPGDEVIVPANTFFASAEAVSLCGAKPVFVDCEEDYYNMDPAKIEAAITERTKVILPVHLYGQPAQMDAIKAIADKHNLLLLEDSAQAHLATFKGSSVGTIGLAGGFSFYPGKNLGAYGEAGGVVTNDEALYQKMQTIKDHGSQKKYFHDLVGHNYRMDGMQGSILSVKLKYLAEWTAIRNRNAELYGELLQGIDQVITPKQNPDVYHAYHLYVIRVPNRTELTQFLNENGIYTGIHYPIPCHLQKAYAHLNYPEGAFPNSEKFAREIVSLPMSEQLSTDEVTYVAEKIRTFYQG